MEIQRFGGAQIIFNAECWCPLAPGSHVKSLALNVMVFGVGAFRRYLSLGPHDGFSAFIKRGRDPTCLSLSAM